VEGSDDKSTNKDEGEKGGVSGGDAESSKEISNLEKDNKPLAAKVLNEAGESAGSDKSTCMMLTSNF